MEASTSFEKVENKTLKLEQEEEVDRISALPDSILQHILSYLPSTKEAIRTSVLSKRWKNQWSGVSNLIFDSTGMSDEQSLSFIDTTLIQHGCYNIKKFQIRLDGRNVNRDAHLYEKIHFSIKRHVEELILEFPHCNIELPPFLFNHPPLVKLQTLGCTIVPNDRINWERLKELSMMRCKLPDDMVESILSCCPLLDLLSLSSCFGFGRLIVASDSLKKLELIYLHSISVLEISCPNLEEFWLHGYIDVMATTFKNLSSLIRANLAFEHEMEDFEGSSVKEILEQLQHVEELTYGCQLLEAILWDFDWQPDLSPLSLKNKCLTFDSPDFKAYSHSGAIKYALLSSPFLEKLVITKEAYIEFAGDSPVRMSQREHYWSRVESDFKCLKFVQFIGLPDDDQDYTLVLDFLGFLLKNSRVLEKLVVTLQDGGRDFENEVSEILLSFPRCSAHAVIEVLGSHRIVTNI